MDLEEQALPVGTFPVRPVVVGIDLCIQHELRKEEVGDGTGDAPIVVTFLVAMHVGKVGLYLLQFFDDELERVAS